MELTVSNIAWTNEEEPEIANALADMGVRNIEIAPTKKWQDPTVTVVAELVEYKNWWNSYDMDVVAFQSMLFNRVDLKLFESSENREDTFKYLSKFIEVAGVMGAKAMVFGSPKNRQLEGLSKEAASLIAVNFFSSLAEVALKNNVNFCIEPNAPQYNCDFANNSSDGLELVEEVGKAGFGLHLDTACMQLAGDNLVQSIINSKNALKHFHVSAPYLEPVNSSNDINHKAVADALRLIDYKGKVSIEMKPGDSGTNLGRVKEAVEFVRSVYSLS